ncbi:hypothetical protein GCM10027413_19770 [Conyzicola nivalis]|uniref:Uncharacterized protein n=1 Tax=Conyzicola nivalis TaxID=1477021 RepID=A0A916SCX8_9MICO|nr:IniB N-terminal domain-containing protein [Conyzicola nivalis]GGA95003.1 hypothetical protein GCM10010979_06850 [Conyzicola nivalis]
MNSPVATIADALIAFILSLLRDPDAAEKFTNDPQGAMAENGVQGASLADVRDVKPVIFDNPQVEPKPPTPSAPASAAEPDEVVVEIVRIMNQFTTVDANHLTTVDARSTIVDQSVNQNIWTEGGDVTQLFDQEAVIAAGDDAVAAGNDASTIDQDLDLTVGDVTVGNDTYNDSFTDADIAVSAPQPDAPDAPEQTDSPEQTDAVQQAPGAEPEAQPAPEAAEPPVLEAPQTPASLPEPADNLESDLTTVSGDSYDPGTATLPDEQIAIDDPVDE